MKKAILRLTVAVVLLVSPAYAGEILKISGLPNYPPVSWKSDETLMGVGPELAGTIFRELGVPFRFKPLPWVRALSEMEHGQIDVIAGAYIKTERQKYMNYSIPFMKDPGAIFVMKDRAFTFNELKDLIGKKGVNMLGYSWGEAFDGFAKKHLNVVTATKPLQALQMLERGRVDYFVYGLYSGLFVAAKAGMGEKVEALPHYVSYEDLCLTFSRKSKFSQLLPKVNEIIKRLKDEGAIDKWTAQCLKKYRDSLATHR